MTTPITPHDPQTPHNLSSEPSFDTRVEAQIAAAMENADVLEQAATALARGNGLGISGMEITNADRIVNYADRIAAAGTIQAQVAVALAQRLLVQQLEKVIELLTNPPRYLSPEAPIEKPSVLSGDEKGHDNDVLALARYVVHTGGPEYATQAAWRTLRRYGVDR